MGWSLSRAILYTGPNVLAYGACIIWGILAVVFVHAFFWGADSNSIYVMLLGYGFGWYISNPAFGLFDEGTIPAHAWPRHVTIQVLPMTVYIAASICLAIWNWSL